MTHHEPRSFEKASEKIADLEKVLNAVVGEQSTFERAFEVSLLCTIHSQARSILILEKAGQTYDAQILLRSLLEHSVELILLRDQPERHLNVKFHFEESQRKTLSEAQTDNPYFKGISSTVPIDQELAKVKARKAEYSDAGGKKTTITADWKTAGMEDAYESVYRLLSKYAHPSYSGAIARNIPNYEQLLIVEIAPTLQGSTRDVISDTLCGVLENAIQIANDIASS